jgi:hypothetical protein
MAVREWMPYGRSWQLKNDVNPTPAVENSTVAVQARSR